MSKIDELIGATKQMEVEFDRNAISNTQVVLGQERLVCASCGFCPNALLQELEAVKAVLGTSGREETR